MTGYTKLFSSILMSSIWEESTETRLVWVTMLALADQNGHVDGTVKSLARVSRVSIEECQQALDCLLGPDADDRSGVRDGRRLVPEPGGWLLVNHATYRHKMSADDRRERDRIRKRNSRLSAPRPQVSANVRDFQQAEAEAEADTKASPKAKAAADVRPAPLMTSPMAYERRKQQCAFVGSRLEVPHGLHADLRKLLGGSDPEAGLMAWYLSVNEEIEVSGEPITPTIFKWLTARFSVWAKGVEVDPGQAAVAALNAHLAAKAAKGLR